MDMEQQLIEVRKQHKRDCEELEQRFEELKKDLENNKKEFNKIFKDSKESNDTVLNSVKFELYDNILQITYLRENRSLLYEKLIKKIKENDPTKDTEQAYEEAKGKLISNEEIRELLTKEQIKEMYKEDRKDFECIKLTQEQLKVYKKLLKYDNTIISIPFEIKDLEKINLDVLKNTIKKEIENTQKIKEILEDREKLRKEIFDVSNEMSKQEKEVQGKLQTVIFYDYENLLKILEIGQKIDNYFNIQDYPNLSKRDYEYRLEQEEEMLQYIKDGLEEKRAKNFKPINPNSLITMNDKVTRELKKLAKDIEQEILNVKGYDNPYKDEKVTIILQNVEMQTSQVITPFDEIVLDSIYTLMQSNKYFDVAMIKRLLTQQVRNTKIQLDNDIKESIEKMRVTIIRLTFSDFLNESYQKPLSKKMKNALKVGDYLLPIRNVEVIKGGTEKEVYLFAYEPLYFAFTKMQNQFITSDVKLLDVPMSQTKDNILIKTYIAKRISNMKYQNKKQQKSPYKENTINVETVFNELELLKDEGLSENTYNVKRKRYYAVIKEILNEYKKKGIIGDYKINKGEKNRVKSYTIIF